MRGAHRGEGAGGAIVARMRRGAAERDTFVLHPGPAGGPAYRPSPAPHHHRGEVGRAVRAIHPSIAPSSGLLIATSNDPSAASASLPSV